jgi:glutamate N-acetyltransferase/amino-acid N-acetyltransferase
MTQTTSSITRVAGFRAVGVACGLKDSGKPDLALIVSDQPCTGAAVFTRNLFKAAPVLYDVELLKRNQARVQGVVVNAGNANAITGAQGLRDAERMARLTETVCDLPVDSVFVMSTGVIGHLLPMANIERGIRLAGEATSTESGLQGRDAARAIMTTDLVPKEAFLQTTIGGRTVSIGAIAKGSGMIHPDMATLLSVIVTDAVIEPDVLNLALKQAVDRSFNRLTVDGDTSTNDTVLCMASSRAGHEPIAETGQQEFQDFVGALVEVCTRLAKMIARDGEGATKLVEVRIRGAANDTEAERAAKTVATSPLVKTALFGNDPNWGRTLAAIGRSAVEVDPTRVSLRLGRFSLVEDGEATNFDVAAVQEWLSSSEEIVLEIDLNLGQAEATVWTCDLSYGYIEINAEYHT